MSHLALQDCRDRCFNCNKGGFIGDHQVRGSELFMGDLRRFQAVKPDKVTDKSPMQKKKFDVKDNTFHFFRCVTRLALKSCSKLIPFRFLCGSAPTIEETRITNVYN